MLSFKEPIDLNSHGIPVTAYRDDKNIFTFYLLAQVPRIRLDRVTKKPSVSLFKYRFPVDHEDGSKGGGFLFLDVECVVPEDLKPTITQLLQAKADDDAEKLNLPTETITFSQIPFTSGTARINFEEEDSPFVHRSRSIGMPSLFGDNVTSFALELTPAGTTLFEAALRGENDFVTVWYTLDFLAVLPAVEVKGDFSASAFYSFYQDVDTEWNRWGEDEYRETIRQSLIEREAYELEITPMGEVDEEMMNEIRDWATRTMDDAVERRMIESIPPVSEEDREVPDGIEDVTRNISETKISSFSLRYKENAVVTRTRAPQDSLGGLKNRVDADGNPINIDDYITVVDLDDPFFKQINVAVNVNADFENLPIDSVEVKLEYNGRPMNVIGADTEGEVKFESADDIGKFAAYVEDDNWEYQFSYEINYKGKSEKFISEKKTSSDAILTIGVDDIGILDTQIFVGDIDFDEVQEARVKVSYVDDQLTTPKENQFRLTADNREPQRFQEILFHPRNGEVEYEVEYTMSDGKKLEKTDLSESGPRIFVDDPFSDTKTIAIRALGDLKDDIDTIFVEMKYVDRQNDYTQELSKALNKNLPFFDWSFPVFNLQNGTLSFTQTVTYQDTDKEPDIERKDNVVGNTVFVGPQKKVLEVELVTDLLDFSSEVKLIRMSLEYPNGDGENAKKNEVFSKRRPDSRSVRLEFDKDVAKEYMWSAEFYMYDGSKLCAPVSDPISDDIIVLEVPTEVCD